MKTPYRLAVLSLLTLSVIACSATSTDWQPSEAALAGDPLAMWADGEVAVGRGEELLMDGESRLENARRQIRDGEAMVNDGNDRVLQSRQEYQNAARLAGSSLTPEQVEFESDRFRSIGRRWDAGIEQIKEGNQLIMEGNEDSQLGQEEIMNGRSLIESGSVLMRNSQRTILGTELMVLPEQDIAQ